jgi:hypothetical protein
MEWLCPGSKSFFDLRTRINEQRFTKCAPNFVNLKSAFLVPPPADIVLIYVFIRQTALRSRTD